ncbi:hypothetical protein BpHYR1_005616 [Brachionus plicatilis]|uniref:Uncharacterized protein n=1 Tax=Brachionus plicatilis TaxID=10195 RepID=A0A3M7P714_BRAPC|nr:hypothetical protein BpHYR1_005616 [Brachionus plicatilis]
MIVSFENTFITNKAINSPKDKAKIENIGFVENSKYRVIKSFVVTIAKRTKLLFKTKIEYFHQLGHLTEIKEIFE